MQARTTNKLNRLRIALENMMTPLDLAGLAAPDAGLADIGVGLPAGKPPTTRRLGGPSGAAPDAGRNADRLGRLAEKDARRHEGQSKRAPEQERLVKQAEFGVFVHHALWCEKLLALCAKSQKTEPERFFRKRLSPYVLFFSDGGDRGQKVLVICFTGGARRMMMPLPIFLQHLDACLVDIVLLCDPSKEGYRGSGDNETHGNFDSFEGLLGELDAMLDRQAYRGAVAIGTSAGGLPAVLAGLRLELDTVLAVGSNDPHDPRWQPVGGIGAPALLERYLAQTTRAAPEIFLLYSADYPRDGRAARSISAIVPAKHICHDPQTRTPTGHAILWPILNQGQLVDLLDSTLLSRFQEIGKARSAAWVTG